MNYHEAVAIAKSNPGSVMTRNAASEFIVRLANGDILESSGETQLSQSLLRIRELEGEKLRLTAHVDELERELSKARDHLDLASSRIHYFEEQVSILSSLIAELKSKTAKVSNAEWERIAKEEQQYQDEVLRMRIALRQGGYDINNAFAVSASTDGQD